MAEKKTRAPRSGARTTGETSRTTKAETDPSAPKTTRPPADSRRPAADEIKSPDDQPAGKLHKFDAVPDRVDVRDWFYQPSLRSLPDVMVNCHLVDKPLDQGQEGACTGYALAAVINCLLRQRDIERSVSPKMLYDMARRYDEWPGESYSGSSARGAMKGWIRHGVVTSDRWPDSNEDLSYLQAVIPGTKRTVADEALQTPGGAFYRVSHREVRHMHAALGELGVLYCTLMVHDGWQEPAGAPVEVQCDRRGTLRLPVIKRKGRAQGGHAVAILGYTATGFIILNSWGESWGKDGFALLPYEDFLLHATDVWAAQLGVPVTADLWGEGKEADTTAGIQRASRSIPLNDIRPFIIDVGNNGKLSDAGDYWTTEGDIKRLFTETIPAASRNWQKKRVLFYLHGGLNSEGEVAKRVLAFRDVFLANEIYPLHVMWESGAAESFKDIFRNAIGDERAGADWMRKLRDGYLEARDATVELTVSRVGGALWNAMKNNARLMSESPDGLGALQIAAKYAGAALAGSKEPWEFHVVGHSAGSIVAAHAVELFSAQRARFATLQLMAPAVRLDTFKERVVKQIGKSCPLPTLYVLSDVGERDDDVGVGAVAPYGKSLLYLVSNAFEGKRGTPLLGMARYLTPQPDSESDVDPELRELFSRQVDGHQSLVIAGEAHEDGDPFSKSRSDSHGGFDNDPDTMNSVLSRILGRLLAQTDRKFGVRDLQY